MVNWDQSARLLGSEFRREQERGVDRWQPPRRSFPLLPQGRWEQGRAGRDGAEEGTALGMKGPREGLSAPWMLSSRYDVYTCGPLLFFSHEQISRPEQSRAKLSVTACWALLGLTPRQAAGGEPGPRGRQPYPDWLGGEACFPHSKNTPEV